MRNFASIVVACALLGSSCASTKTTPSELTFDQTVEVRSMKGKKEKRKKGETFVLKDEPVYVESPGHVSLLVIPKKEEEKKIQINLRPMEKWGGEVFQKKLNEELSEVLVQVNEVHMLMAQKRMQSALQKVKSLQKKYPHVSYLEIIEASCLFLMGKQTQAKFLLNRVLKEFPEDQSAKSLMRSIAGEESQ